MGSGVSGQGRVGVEQHLAARADAAHQAGRFGHQAGEVKTRGLQLAHVEGVGALRLLFGFGAASEASAIVTGNVVQVFALGLLPFTLVYLLFRGWYALEDTRSPFLVTLVVNAVNLGISIPLFHAVPVALRVPALAVAYVLAYWAAMAWAWPRLERRLGGLETATTLRSLVRMVVAGALAAGTGSLLLLLLGSTLATAGRPAVLGLSSGLAVVMLAVYVGASRAMHVPEVGRALALVRGRLRRR